MKRWLRIASVCSLLGAAPAADALDLEDASLEEAIEALEARGLSVLYSSDLIRPDMRVTRAPSATAARAQLEEILAPHGVRVAEGPGGLLLLTRAVRVPSAAAPDDAHPVQEVVVTASRYAWVRTPQLGLTRLSEAELHLAPNVGDDPLRTLARLPGAAAADFSAKIYMRGGAADETLVRFDGLRLSNPFHLKDFQSIFSAIDPALVGAVDVYTGGFPVSFGDRMSGVIDIHPVRAEAAPRRELAVTLFHASAFGAGRFGEGRGDWAVAARRGNLDRVIDWSGLKLGDPSYSDVYLHAGHELGESMAIAVNALGFDDDIELADSDIEERARARYRDRYVWLRLDAHPHESLAGATLLARTNLESVRSGEAEQPGIGGGVLDDRREFTIDALQSDWSWRAGRATLVQFGGEWRRSTGRYRYSDEAQFDLHFIVPGMQGAQDGARAVDMQRAGDQYGGYASVRVDVAEPITLEGGLRFDRSTLSDAGWYGSPRAAVLYRIDGERFVRAGWGRFVQTRSIDELAVSDGETQFSRAQRADHWLVSFEQRLNPEMELRFEGYYKRYAQLAPRYENLLNPLVILPELKPDRMRIAPSQARAMGVEASLRSLRSRPLFWWASYAWSRAEDELAGADVRRSWDQEHALHAGFGWETGRWEISLAAGWRSGWPKTTPALVLDENGEAFAFANANSEREETYVDIDARIARKFTLQGGATVTAFLEVSNLLNRRNACCTEYELDDEAEEPTLVLESIRSVPLTPSLGVVWRF